MRHGQRQFIYETWLFHVLSGLTAMILWLVADNLTMNAYTPYDDEGYILLSLREFINGKPLYTEVFSQYGPFFFIIFKVIFCALHLSITHDNGRIISSIIWITSSWLLGISVLRFTGKYTLGLLSQITSFGCLAVLAVAPMHPVGLIALLLSTLTLAISHIGDCFSRAGVFISGAVVAMLILVKINVGAFALIAFIFAISQISLWNGLRLRGCLLTAVLFVSTPLLLMKGQLGSSSVDLYALHVCMSTLAFVSICLFTQARYCECKEVWNFVFAIVITIGIVFVITLTNTDLTDFIDGVVIAPLKHPGNYSDYLHLNTSILIFDVFSIAFCLLYILFQKKIDGAGSRPRLVFSFATVLVGLLELIYSCFWVVRSHGVMSTYTYDSGPIAFGGNPFAMMSLAWVALIKDRRAESDRSFSKMLVVALALAESLHAYPVAGSQVGLSTFLLAVVAILTIDNGVNGLAFAQSTIFKNVHLFTYGTIVAICYKIFILNFYQAGQAQMAAEQALDLPGSVRQRAPEIEAERIRKIAHALDEICPVFITMPGINSFYLWTQRAPPTSTNVTFWSSVLDADQQQRMVRKIENIDGLCLLRNDRLQADWEGGKAPQERPLWKFAMHGFSEIDDFGGDYKLYRRSAPSGRPDDGASGR